MPLYGSVPEQMTSAGTSLKEGGQDRFRDKTGLPVATYFSGKFSKSWGKYGSWCTNPSPQQLLPNLLSWHETWYYIDESNLVSNDHGYGIPNPFQEDAE